MLSFFQYLMLAFTLLFFRTLQIGGIIKYVNPFIGTGWNYGFEP